MDTFIYVKTIQKAHSGKISGKMDGTVNGNVWEHESKINIKRIRRFMNKNMNGKIKRTR